jgi:hypothetical protein
MSGRVSRRVAVVVGDVGGHEVAVYGVAKGAFGIKRKTKSEVGRARGDGVWIGESSRNVAAIGVEGKLGLLGNVVGICRASFIGGKVVMGGRTRRLKDDVERVETGGACRRVERGGRKWLGDMGSAAVVVGEFLESKEGQRGHFDNRPATARRQVLDSETRRRGGGEWDTRRKRERERERETGTHSTDSRRRFRQRRRRRHGDHHTACILTQMSFLSTPLLCSATRHSIFVTAISDPLAPRHRSTHTLWKERSPKCIRASHTPVYLFIYLFINNTPGVSLLSNWLTPVIFCTHPPTDEHDGCRQSRPAILLPFSLFTSFLQ